MHQGYHLLLRNTLALGESLFAHSSFLEALGSFISFSLFYTLRRLQANVYRLIINVVLVFNGLHLTCVGGCLGCWRLGDRLSGGMQVEY